MNWPERPDKNHEILNNDASFEGFTAVMFSSQGLMGCDAL
jgi:hypothetical protein